MTRPFRSSDFTSRIAAGANLAIVPDRCLTRLAPTAAPTQTAVDRTLRFVFSDGNIDRYGDKIDPNGWILANFNANPIALWSHDATIPPIGRASNVGVVNGKLIGSIEFLSSEISPLADAVFQMFKFGFLNAVSVGFTPIEWKESADRSRAGGIDFSRCELLEISAVPIPALPSALVQARAAGINTNPFADWADRQLASKDTPAMSRQSLQVISRDFGGAPTARASGRSSAIEPVRKPADGFESFGHFLRATLSAADAYVDPRLVRAPTSAGEVDPTGGGFLVPTEYESELIGSIYEEAILAPLCDRRRADKPAKVKLPAIDEKSRADGSRWGGAVSYWLDEGTQPPASLPHYMALEFSAKKLISLVVATEELIQDVQVLDTHVRRAFAAEISFKLDLAIFRGTGAGTPLGILNAPGAITVPKANGQAAGTIIAENITAMWSRLPGPSRRRAVWLVNEDAEGQLDQINASVSTSAAGMYFPAGTGGNPYPLLKGRPVIVVEQASVLGAPGDIVLADLSEYVLIDGGIKSDLSLDVLWDSYQGVFRFVWRGDGKPTRVTPITPFNGGATRSPYVILAKR